MPGSFLLTNNAGTGFLDLTPSDNHALLGMIPAVMHGYDGVTADMYRMVTTFKSIAATAVVAGTGLTAWDPASGKKFRMMGYILSSSAATQLIFYEGLTTALTNVLLRTPTFAANQILIVGYPMLGPNGIISSTADMNLNIDVVGNSTISGCVFGCEE